ncbi:hypothetical protein DFH06DRAFT_1143507 [Mycena polygramma]|nr:hypothetical protein DFH06DRAFT_1143507 [Mycena polygramma]
MTDSKRPRAVGQGTSGYVDAGIPSVASIGLLDVARQRENLIDESLRGETLDRAIDVELEGAQGIQRPWGAETWASAKEKKSGSSSYYRVPRSPPQSVTVCEEMSGIDLEVEGAARTIEYRALLVEMRPFAGLTLKSREQRVLLSTALSSSKCDRLRVLELPVLSTPPATSIMMIHDMIRATAESAHSHIASKSVNSSEAAMDLWP